MKRPHYNNATFLLSSPTLAELPPDEGTEVAFIGRSNAGKSSALNTITGLKALARTSKTPGRTQMINLFKLDDHRRLVDLPGYGYAKVPLGVKQRWQRTINDYLQTRQCLKGLVLIMDVRHPLKENDKHCIAWAALSNLPIHILLTKADKLSRGAAINTLIEVRKALETTNGVTVQLFSSLNKTGLEEALMQLDSWFEAKVID
ncbi:MAG: YihA family ribosome biogenesis GTP-binding protein [Gammaproteobacteria bacterium]|nr:YihA family ribosome biogenesis GTP-binding protein [Gammaproteobacteria bacterium]